MVKTQLWPIFFSGSTFVTESVNLWTPLIDILDCQGSTITWVVVSFKIGFCGNSNLDIPPFDHVSFPH